ncbi:TetR/AcrR family transcriptional regulator [Paenibacillus lutimineralis]|uniref:TetR/AcrR family transcriptional regulator n=1 Tax=Paenibacillus lutimineralis TaxID=2707005 RepID=A0A3Q9I766_9BACL|nr:TetR/AcrR family transcriptional regulator [Paenibacillus lutimineralis]AZS14257.1 TetR/AcrR family transcriptional regulator [Paenibacillus lutimineralis]
MSLTPKAIEKKNYILEKASNVFTREGYTVVTMKDIVEECGISRGGLYKYYGSTKEIFEDILAIGKEADYSYFEMSMKNEGNALVIMDEFFRLQKDELLNAKNSIRVATYEYFLSQGKSYSEKILEEYFNDAVAGISSILSYGIKRKEIKHLDDRDVEKTARHIVITLEGLNILAMSTSISSNLIQEQLDILKKLII